MSTAISVLGGIGLFLLGMTIMTDGLKGLAGSSLRTVLGKAAATPIETMQIPAARAALAKLDDSARQLEQLKRAHRGPTLRMVGTGGITVDQALGRIETVRRLEALARHAWRAVAHLLGEEAETPK
jgi:phosphate:Na+ symporter